MKIQPLLYKLLFITINVVNTTIAQENYSNKITTLKLSDSCFISSVRTIYAGEKIIVNCIVPFGSKVVWEPNVAIQSNDNNFYTFYPTKSTSYTMIATYNDSSYCLKTIIINVVEPLSIPNAISPNDDGINDIFYIISLMAKTLFPAY